MNTNTHCFCIFKCFILFHFINFYLKNKINQNWKESNRKQIKQSNSVISFGNQNQFPSSFAPLGDLLNALMFLSNLNGYKFSPLPLDQKFTQRKGYSKVWKEKGSKWFSHFSSLSLYFFFYALLLCFAFLFLSQSSFMLCFV